MALRTIISTLSDAFSWASLATVDVVTLATQVAGQREHIESLTLRLEYMAKQRDAAEESEAATAKAHDEAVKAWDALRTHATSAIQARNVAQKDRYDAEAAMSAANDRAALAKRECDKLKEVLGNTLRELDQAREAARVSQESIAFRAAEDAAKVAAAEACGDALRKQVDTLRAKLAELQSGEPYRWALVTPGDTVHSYYLSESEAAVASMGTVDVVTPLYRHPPRLIGEPVAWLVRFLANGTEGITACVVEETADKLAGLYSGTKTPLYAAPRLATDEAKIREAIALMAEGRLDDANAALRCAIDGEG